MVLGRKHRRGDIVYVRTVGLSPQIDGVYQIKRNRPWFCTFPYAIEHDGETILLDAKEVKSLGRIVCR